MSHPFYEWCNLVCSSLSGPLNGSCRWKFISWQLLKTKMEIFFTPAAAGKLNEMRSDRFHLRWKEASSSLQDGTWTQPSGISCWKKKVNASSCWKWMQQNMNTNSSLLKVQDGSPEQRGQGTRFWPGVKHNDTTAPVNSACNQRWPAANWEKSMPGWEQDVLAVEKTLGLFRKEANWRTIVANNVCCYVVF